MIENLKKHIGQLKNTGVRVAVVFRKIPNDETNCLIVETERLPASYHDFIMHVLDSKEAKETADFYEILNRRTFPDGSNCLTSLHQKNFLRKELITNVDMIPLPNQIVPLALINATIDKKVDQYKVSQIQPEVIDVPDAEIDTLAIAKGLIVQAELLEKDAESKKEEAYSMHPELKPKPGRPLLPEEIKAEKLKERKAKRLEKDRIRAASQKIIQKEVALDAKVSAKIERDKNRLTEV